MIRGLLIAVVLVLSLVFAGQCLASSCVQLCFYCNNISGKCGDLCKESCPAEAQRAAINHCQGVCSRAAAVCATIINATDQKKCQDACLSGCRAGLNGFSNDNY